MADRFKFNADEIEFVAGNMDCHTRHYVEATYKAAMRRAQNKKWPEDARKHMSNLAATMKHALDTWQPGMFDSAIGCNEDTEISPVPNSELVRVKPLQWQEDSCGSQAYFALTEFGTYSVSKNGRVRLGCGRRIKVDGGIDVAKAVAQSDYERRNLADLDLSAVTSLVSDNSELVQEVKRLREAAGNAYRACMSAWACGEPPHRVKTMIEEVERLGVAIGEAGAAALSTSPQGGEHE